MNKLLTKIKEFSGSNLEGDEWGKAYNALHAEILKEAHKNEGDFIAFVGNINHNNDALTEVYAALKTDGQRWESFLFAELERGIKAINDEDDFWSLGEIVDFPEASASFKKKVISFLVKKLSDPNKHVKLKIIELLTFCLDDKNIGNHQNVVEELKVLLGDPNSEVRKEAYTVLLENFKIDRSELKIGFIDNFRMKFLGDSIELESDDNPLDKKANQWLFFFFFIVSIIMVFVNLKTFNWTIISWTIPVTIWVGSAFVLSPFTKRFYIKKLQIHLSYLRVFLNFITFGSLLTFIFLVGNRVFLKGELKAEKFKIESVDVVDSGGDSSCNKYCWTTINGVKQRFSFSCSKDVEQHTYIVLKTRTGLFGYDYILDRKLE
jgi:hypothetical protein